jgi:hypothetical protein
VATINLTALRAVLRQVPPPVQQLAWLAGQSALLSAA